MRRPVPGKARVHELAKEFGVDSKTVLAKLKEQGEFVKSASSTVEAPVARRIREAFATSGNGGTDTAAPARPGPRRPSAAAAAPAAPAEPAAPVVPPAPVAPPAAATPAPAARPVGPTPGPRPAPRPAEPQAPAAAAPVQQPPAETA